MKTFGQQLKAARLAAGLSQLKLSAITGDDQSNLSRWELGKIEPVAHRVLVRLAVGVGMGLWDDGSGPVLVDASTITNPKRPGTTAAKRKGR